MTIPESVAAARAHQKAGELPAAEAVYRQVLQRDPGHAVALHQLGILLFQTDRAPEALELLRRAAAAAPQDVTVQNNLAVVLESLARFAEAVKSYDAALRIQPRSLMALFNRGNALRALGRWDDAIASYREALEIEPSYVEAMHNLGALLKEKGQREQAEQLFRKAIALQPNLVDAHVNLGSILQAFGKVPEALASFREAQRIRPGYPDAVAGEAGVLEHEGRLDEARAALLPLVESGTPNADVALIFANMARVLDRREEAVAALQRVLADKHLLLSKRQSALFGLGKLLDGLKRNAEAFEAYDLANKIKPRQFDLARFFEFSGAVMKTFTREFLQACERATNESQVPVFVVGMPRSGTSLVEQILATHADVYGAGELPEIDRLALSMPAALGTPKAPFPECAASATMEVLDQLAGQYLRLLRGQSPTARHVVDKMPGNFMHVGLLEMLFPRARVIHIQRTAEDNCLSCYFQNFNNGHDYTYDLRSLGQVYRRYVEVMSHWRSVSGIALLEVRYEELVADQEAQTRRLLEFCGLDWDERCLRFHETKRVVRTASYDQVRQPLYSRSAGRWRHYEKFLGPLREGLETPVAT